MYAKNHPTTRAERRACREAARVRLGHIALLKPRQRTRPTNHRPERRNARHDVLAERSRYFERS
jgi:hypothetical protein